MIDAGVDIDMVSELMRHTSSNTTVKYYIARTKKRMHNNADKVAKAYAQLDLGSDLMYEEKDIPRLEASFCSWWYKNMGMTTWAVTVLFVFFFILDSPYL